MVEIVMYNPLGEQVMTSHALDVLQLTPEQLALDRTARAGTCRGSFVGWADLSTGRKSVSLGRDAYLGLVEDAGLTLVAEHDDEGENHYYEAIRGGGDDQRS